MSTKYVPTAFSGSITPSQLNAEFGRVSVGLRNTIARNTATGAPVDSGNQMEVDLSLNSHKITNVADGVAPQDAVNKRQLDSVTSPDITGLNALLAELPSLKAAITLNKQRMIPFSFVGDVPDAGTVMADVVFTQPMMIKADQTGGRAFAGTNPSADTVVVNLVRVDSAGGVTPVGTVSFAGGVGTVTIPADITIPKDFRLRVVASAPLSASSLTFSLKATV